MDMGNMAVLAASVALKGWWRDWSDWQWNDRQSQSFCLSFKVIFRSKKPLILDVIVIVIGNFVIVTPVWDTDNTTRSTRLSKDGIQNPG